ncbi:MAG: response regulator [Patescibacteria group bacterium]
MKALIIDDDDFLLDIYSTKFRESGFEVEISKEGKDVESKAREFNPDLILLDLVMPNIDGFEILKILKKDGVAPNAKISILSNLDQKENIDKGLSLGADDYIIKADFTPSEVVERAKKLLTPLENLQK